MAYERLNRLLYFCKLCKHDRESSGSGYSLKSGALIIAASETTAFGIYYPENSWKNRPGGGQFKLQLLWRASRAVRP